MQRFTMVAGLGVAAVVLLGATLAIGCSGEGSGTPDADEQDASADRHETASTDDDDDRDAGPHADTGGTAQRDASGPGADGDTCSFNYDCQLGLRCECDGECACKAGTRGKKEAGASCDGGNDCASAICLEGPDDALLCSDECTSASDCPEDLPLCQDIAYVGRICTRTPPP